MNPSFIFVVCQTGTESQCKREVTDQYPELKFSFSKPGFVTFKVPDTCNLPERFYLRSTFARTFGWSIGNLRSDQLSDQLNKINELTHDATKFDHLHVWQRDVRIPGSSGFEPGCSLLAQEMGKSIQHSFSENKSSAIAVNRHAQSEQRVFDVIMIEPDYWFYGFHYADTKPQRWPGGTPQFDLDQEPVSRAYFKLREALLWSGIHIRKDDVCAEIGSSPGGACQLLLEKGAKVIAIDPADMEPEIAEHENLTHYKCRGKEIKKNLLKDTRWLISDVNVAPSYTLDMIDDIITNQHVNKVMGMILTLKLSDLELSTDIPQWIQRVKDFGFQWVKTRQLAFNRREICLIAVRDRYALRLGKKSSS